MPIDFNLIFAPLLLPMHIQWRAITDAMESIAKQVSRRLERASGLERASRDFPVPDFREEALVVTIAAAQKGALGPRPAEPFWPASIRQEWLLPRFAIMLAATVNDIRDSIARFQMPDPSMFSGAHPKFVDIFGHAGMVWRALVQDYRPVRLLENTAAKAKEWYVGLGLAKSAGSGAGGGLDDLPAQLAGALILIPAFFNWFAAVLRFLDVAVRARTLDEFTKIQERVFLLRRDLLGELFLTLRNVFQGIFEVYFVLDKILLRTLVYWSRFATIYIGMLGEQLSAMSEFLAKWVNLIVAIAGAIAGALDLLRDMTLPGGVRIGELIDYVSGNGGGVLMKELDAIEAATRGTRLNGIVAVYRALMRAAVARPRVVAPPKVAPLPDLYKVAIRPYEGRLFKLLHGMRDAMVPAIQEGLEQGADKLLEVGEAAARTARASTGIPRSIWDNVLGSATSIAGGLFEGADRSVRKDDLAQLYEQSIVTAGFATINAAIPRYIGGVIDWWRARHRAQPQGKVSPHILNKRVRLLRVRTPRMTFRVHDFDLHDQGSRKSLLALLQKRMKEKVEQSWRTGELEAARL